MWAEELTLRVGDLVVGIGVQEPAMAAALRVAFAPYLDESVAPAPVALSVRTGLAREVGRSMHLVHYGCTVMARCRDAAAVEERLRGVLGGIVATLAHTDRPRSRVRAFVNGTGQAVAVVVPTPTLLDDRRLAADRITELASHWALFEAPHHLLEPPALAATPEPLPEPSTWRRYELVGGLSPSQYGDANAFSALVRALGGGRTAFSVVRRWWREGLVSTESDITGQRATLRELLSPAAQTFDDEEWRGARS